MLSLTDAVFALHDLDPKWNLFARLELQKGFWPPLKMAPDGGLSLRNLCQRFSATGAQLRKLANSKKDLWKHIDRDDLVSQLRDRIRDPGIIHQNPTGLCGPVAIVFELARRNPVEYVRAVTELFEHGVFTTMGGAKIEAEQELRNEHVPDSVPQHTPSSDKGADPDDPSDDVGAGMKGSSGGIHEADWILAATMRDFANVHDDVDDNAGNEIESYTLGGAMADWTKNVLGLIPINRDCAHTGELDVIRAAQAAINVGGVAFLNIDSDLLNSGGTTEVEENMWWKVRRHVAGEAAGGFGGKVHSCDDNGFLIGDHWVPMLGDLKLDEKNDSISLLVWSWSAEYLVFGTADSFGEYLYGAVLGMPK